MRRLFILTALFAAGCGGGRAPLASDEEARQAVETALNAWKEGKAPGVIASTPQSIEAIDSHWTAKEELAGFTLGPAESGEGCRIVPAKLTMKTPASEVDARYYVVGGGPIFVYRDEDYQRMTNMENGPASPGG